MTENIIFYTGKERIGKFYTSQLCFRRTQEYQVSDEILRETFRYGKEVEPGKLAYPDGDRLIIVIYVEDPVKTGIFRGNLNEIWHVFITCWVQKNK